MTGNFIRYDDTNAPGTDQVQGNTVVTRDANGDTSARRFTATNILISQGGFQLPSAAKTTAYTATAADSIIYADASGGAFSITLPAVATSTNMILCAVNVGASGTVTLDGNLSETINGATTATLTTQYSFKWIHCNGAAWFIISS
jgi:hypothetical protein